MSTEHKLQRCELLETSFGGWLGSYLKGVSDQWLKIAPSANPAMLEMFRDRDRTPARDLLPWSGEFAGKYLTAAVQVYHLTLDIELREYVSNFVRELIACQDSDGYLGPWPKDKRLAGEWDAWGHYHAMVGLILWYETTEDTASLECAKKIGDLLCRKFLGAQKGKRLVDIGSSEMNLAPVHSLCLLYERTGITRYLDLAKQITCEFEEIGIDEVQAGDYIRTALDGDEFFQTPKPRWESLHPIMGIASLYHITGNADYKTAFERIWWSIVKTDRHNNGGFSAGEQAQGTPYHTGAIETCCTIAWLAMSVEMLKLTGDSIVADEIEFSTVNSVIGMHSHTGRWVTYNTPMDGVRLASAHSIVFQSREGSPELNCCSVNGPRGFGLISEWGFMAFDKGIVLNYYGHSEVTLALRTSNKVILKQETQYPAENLIKLEIIPETVEEFTLKLRIPYWSANTSIRLNGARIENVAAGTYLEITREWTARDVVEIELDFSLHYWMNEEQPGKASIYRGPILLTYDRRFNSVDPDNVPAIDAANSVYEQADTSEYSIRPIVLTEFTAANGEKLMLCDFGSAGEGGTPYLSWIDVVNLDMPVIFHQTNPLRSKRA